MPAFAVDAMLGTLARWLRILGYDTRYVGSDASDEEVVRLAREEGRVLVTRDRRLAAATGAVLLGMEDDLDAQLRAVFAATGQAPDEERMFTRCSLCNAELADASPEEVAHRVPEKVRARHAAFKRCPRCGQVYWRGSHWDRIRERVARLRG